MQIIREQVGTGERTIHEERVARSRKQVHAIREELARLNQEAVAQRSGYIYYAN